MGTGTTKYKESDSHTSFRNKMKNSWICEKLTKKLQLVPHGQETFRNL